MAIAIYETSEFLRAMPQFCAAFLLFFSILSNCSAFLGGEPLANPFTTPVMQALNPNENAGYSAVPVEKERWIERGAGEWPAWFAVTDLACASIGAAVQQTSALQQFVANKAHASATPTTNNAVNITIDRRLASLWFGGSIRPEGWSLPAAWDSLAGDYKTLDGWIKLHTNAPHHRDAALRALGLINRPNLDKQTVAEEVKKLGKNCLEQQVIAEGGCAAAMRSTTDWLAHPQGQALQNEPLIHWHAGAQESTSNPSSWSPGKTYPLRGVRVLDLTRVLAGPVATRFLARYGAQVLRIDPPSWSEPGVVPEVTLGKRCAELNLKTTKDRQVFESLLRQADIVIHGYRPGALRSLGYGYEQRVGINPNLIDVSLCAYGWSGPWAKRRGFDSLVQMSCGIAHHGMQSAKTDVPSPLPVQALDHATGYLMAAAALRALVRQRSTGITTRAQLSLARTALLLSTSQRANLGHSFTPESANDLEDWQEFTAWGRAQRLKFPAKIGNSEQRWNLPAQQLRSSPPSFL